MPKPTRPERGTFLEKTYQELKGYALAFIAAGALGIAAQYALPDREPVEKQCELAYNLHASYRDKPPSTPIDKRLNDRAGANLLECLR